MTGGECNIGLKKRYVIGILKGRLQEVGKWTKVEIKDESWMTPTFLAWQLDMLLIRVMTKLWGKILT